jgi:tRNA pseudouridine55 synthase
VSFTGFFAIHKPSGMTSRDALDRALNWFPKRTKMGHAGTLDPLATGVLVVAVGHATRLIEYVQEMPKVYQAKIVFGAESTTDDADGDVMTVPHAAPISDAELHAALPQFLGEIDQVPPAISAVKIEGRRAHSLTRQGKEVSLAARKARVDRIDVIRYEWPELEIEVECGKGTYIRSIARDLGQLLKVGGYIQTLHRSRIGPFTDEEAFSLEADPTKVRTTLHPLKMAVSGRPTITADADLELRVRHGKAIDLSNHPDGQVVLLLELGELLAIGQIVEGVYRSEKVMREE